MAGKLTQLEGLRHLVRNRVSCLALGYKELLDALTVGLVDDHKDIAVKQLMRHEGFRPKPYKCTSVKETIGFGINLETESMPYEVALFWLEYKVEENDKILSEKLSFYSDLTDNRKSVLTNMCFNLGLTGLLRFVKTLKFIEQGKYLDASKEMLDSKWAIEDVGKSRSTELSELMKNG